jgi:hypothetical protein
MAASFDDTRGDARAVLDIQARCFYGKIGYYPGSRETICFGWGYFGGLELRLLCYYICCCSF